MKSKGILLLERLIAKEVAELLQPKSMKTILESWHSLIEGRFEDAKKKYPDVAEKLDFFKEVPNKYFDWIAKTIKNTSSQTTKELQDIKDVVLQFDKLVNANKIQKKDINQWDIINLQKTIKDLESTVSNTQVKKQAKGEAKTIYKDGRFTIIQPLSKAASCQYGKGTKWCISATDSKNYWNYYNHPTKTPDINPLDDESTPDEELYNFDKHTGIFFYFILDKTPTKPDWEKVAVAATPSLKEMEIFDAKDEAIEIKELQQYYPNKVLKILSDTTGNLTFLGPSFAVEQFLTDTQNPKETLVTIQRKLEALFTRWWGERDVYGLFKKIVQEIPQKFLPLLYYVSGTQQDPYTLRHANLLDVFQARLEVLPLDTILSFAELSYSTYYVSDLGDWQETDPYYDWLENTPRRFSLEELRKVYNFLPAGFYSPPFRNLSKTLYLKALAPSLGIPVTYADMGFEGNMTTGLFTILNAYATAANTRNTVNSLAQAIKDNNQEQITFLKKRLLGGWGVAPKDLMTFVDLVAQGNINSSILNPLLN